MRSGLTEKVTFVQFKEVRSETMGTSGREDPRQDALSVKALGWERPCSKE